MPVTGSCSMYPLVLCALGILKCFASEHRFVKWNQKSDSCPHGWAAQHVQCDISLLSGSILLCTVIGDRHFFDIWFYSIVVVKCLVVPVCK